MEEHANTPSRDDSCHDNGIGDKALGALVASLEPVQTDTLRVTDTARHEVQRLLDMENQEGLGLRLSVLSGGCSGMRYELEFDQKKVGDEVLACGDFDIYMDGIAAPILRGVTLDFETGLNARGFQFKNPNAKKTCGCGDSFMT